MNEDNNIRSGNATDMVLSDCALPAVSTETHAAFLAWLDRPPQPNDRLRRTMEALPPWDEAPLSDRS